MIKDNAELPDEILNGISDNPILLSWLREVQNSVIEYDKSQQFAFKAGPTSFVSSYINAWDSSYSSDNSLYDSTSSTNGIYIREDGIYKIDGCQRANGTGSAYVGLAINGSRPALEGTDDSLYAHDHASTTAKYSITSYTGFIEADSLITLGPVDSTIASYLFYGPNDYIGSIRVQRISAI